jgi:hypothetical protein
MITFANDSYTYLTGEDSNADIWISANLDDPTFEFLIIFYEDFKCRDKEIFLTICNN